MGLSIFQLFKVHQVELENFSFKFFKCVKNSGCSNAKFPPAIILSSSRV